MGWLIFIFILALYFGQLWLILAFGALLAIAAFFYVLIALGNMLDKLRT